MQRRTITIRLAVESRDFDKRRASLRIAMRHAGDAAARQLLAAGFPTEVRETAIGLDDGQTAITREEARS